MTTYPDEITRAQLSEAIELLKKAVSAADKHEFVVSIMMSGLIQAKIMHQLVKGDDLAIGQPN